MNLTSEATRRAPVDELIHVGPFKVKMAVSALSAKGRARLLVAGGERPVTLAQGIANVDIEGVLDHEVLVVD